MGDAFKLLIIRQQLHICAQCWRDGSGAARIAIPYLLCEAWAAQQLGQYSSLLLSWMDMHVSTLGPIAGRDYKLLKYNAYG